jgi:hypothetical protein
MCVFLCAGLLVLGTVGNAFAFGGIFSSTDRDNSSGEYPPLETITNDYEPTNSVPREGKIHNVGEPAIIILLGGSLIVIALSRRKIKR